MRSQLHLSSSSPQTVEWSRIADNSPACSPAVLSRPPLPGPGKGPTTLPPCPAWPAIIWVAQTVSYIMGLFFQFQRKKLHNENWTNSKLSKQPFSLICWKDNTFYTHSAEHYLRFTHAVLLYHEAARTCVQIVL